MVFTDGKKDIVRLALVGFPVLAMAVAVFLAGCAVKGPWQMKETYLGAGVYKAESEHAVCLIVPNEGSHCKFKNGDAVFMDYMRQLQPPDQRWVLSDQRD